MIHPYLRNLHQLSFKVSHSNYHKVRINPKSSKQLTHIKWLLEETRIVLRKIQCQFRDNNRLPTVQLWSLRKRIPPVIIVGCIAKLISDSSNTLIMAIIKGINTRKVFNRVESNRIRSMGSRLNSSTISSCKRLLTSNCRAIKT